MKNFLVVLISTSFLLSIFGCTNENAQPKFAEPNNKVLSTPVKNNKSPEPPISANFDTAFINPIWGDRPVIAPIGRPYPGSFNVRVSAGGGSGGGGGGSRGRVDGNLQTLLHWNQMAIDASGVDHGSVNVDFVTALANAEQFGPTRSARALAIVHIAVFEALNAIVGGYESYVGLEPVTEETSIRAAMGQAAHDTLAALFTLQVATFDAQLAHDLEVIPDGEAEERGIALGKLAAQKILDLRANDGSNHAEPVIGVDYFPSNDPGLWRKDPISQRPVAMGALWSQVAPFVIESATAFRIPPPPALTSKKYAEAFNEVKRLGGDGVITPTERTREQTEIGIFWAYDGVPTLCAPPRLYNQIVMQIAKQKKTDLIGVARLLALLHVAMADAGLASWESKYHYQVWRPVTAIREADVGTGPSGLGDGNPDTVGDVNFHPLGAPASNISGPNFTPPFPAYPSGHATFGGAIFQVLRQFYGTDDVDFTFMSDEYNGVTMDHAGEIRPRRPRHFSSFSEAEEENGQSRIYLGIHWSFDKTEGIKQGRNVADYVVGHLFQPVGKK